MVFYLKSTQSTPQRLPASLTRLGGLLTLADYSSELATVGMDIGFLGDSMLSTVLGITAASDARNYLAAPAFCRAGMAAAYPEFGGRGMGFLSFTNGTGTFGRNGFPCNTIDAPTPGTDGDTYLSLNASAKGTGCRELSLASGKTRFIGFNFQGTTSTSAPDFEEIKTFYLVYRQYSGGPTIEIDHAVGSWPNRGAGSVRLSVDSNGATVYGKRSSALTFASATATNRVAVRGGATGGAAFIDGGLAIGSGGLVGTHVHDLSNPGLSLQNVSEESLQASIDRFSARDGSPCSNMRVQVLSFLTNDANAYPTVSVSAFLTSLEAIVTRCISRGVVPLVLIPPDCPSSFFYAGNIHDDAYLPMIAGIEEMQADYRTQMAIYDARTWFEAETYPVDGSWIASGLIAEDGRHFAYKGHARLGGDLGKALPICING